MQNKITSLYTAKNLINDIKIICEKFEIFMKNYLRRMNKKEKESAYPLEIVSIGMIGGFGGYRTSQRKS